MGFRFVLLLTLFAIAGCGQDTKTPASPVQPGGLPAVADSTRIAVFADSNLEAAVRQALGNPAGPLTQVGLLSLTQLVARDRGIASLAGIDSLKNLQILDLADNQIHELTPLASLDSLVYLDLANNQISDVAALAALDRLETLVLTGNQVAGIAPLLQLDGLKYLELLGNPLDETALQPCLQLLAQRSVEVYWQVPAPASGPAVEPAQPAASDSLPDVRVEYYYHSPADDLFFQVPGGRYVNVAQATEAEFLAMETLNLWGGIGWKTDSGQSDWGEGPGAWIFYIWTDLAGIDRFANLTRLEVHNHRIADFTPLRALTHLATLIISNEDLFLPASASTFVHVDVGSIDLPALVSILVRLPRLATLILANGGISDISPLLDLPNLTRIGLKGNPLDSQARKVHIPALKARGVVVIL